MPRRRTVNKRVNRNQGGRPQDPQETLRQLRNGGWDQNLLTASNLKTVFGEDAKNVQFIAGSDGKLYPFLPDELAAIGKEAGPSTPGVSGADILARGDSPGQRLKAGDWKGALKQRLGSQKASEFMPTTGVAVSGARLAGKAVGALKGMFGGNKARIAERLAVGADGAAPAAETVFQKGVRVTKEAAGKARERLGPRITGEAGEAAANATPGKGLRQVFADRLNRRFGLIRTGAELGLAAGAFKTLNNAIGQAGDAATTATVGAANAEAQGRVNNRTMELELEGEQKRQDAVRPQMERSLLAKRVSDLTGQMESERLEKRAQINSMYSPQTAVNLLQMANMLTPPMPESSPLGGGP